MRHGLVFATLALAAVSPALADESGYFKGGTETFKITAGGLIGSTDPSVSFNGSTDDGTPVDFGANGGKSVSSVMVSADWRFARKHRVSALWYGTKRSNTYTLANDVIIDDTTIPAGASLTPEIKNDFFFVNYRYSFVKNDNVEIAALLGLYGANFRFDITAVGVPGQPGQTFSRNTSTTLPLPLIGVSLDWYIMPRWNAGASISGLSAKIGDIKGSTWVFTASTDYMIFKNFGLGVAYMHTVIDADVTKDSFNGNINYTTNNFLFYGVVKF
jgi:hypothetical protein